MVGSSLSNHDRNVRSSPTVDLNADLGEGLVGTDDEAMLDVVTSASIACGGHAGDRTTMHHVVEKAAARRVTIGAHPSFVDRAGFGRRVVEVERSVLENQLQDQIGLLQQIASEAGSTVRFVKPHGALYHLCSTNEDYASALARAAAACGVRTLLLRARSPAALAAFDSGATEVLGEAFADRAYLPDGSLAARDQPGSVLSDPDRVVEQAVSLALHKTARAIDGSVVAIEARSICVHGDTPGALRLAKAVRFALEEAGVRVAPFSPSAG